MTRLAIIDDRVINYQLILDSCLESNENIVLNYEIDTLDTLYDKCPQKTYESVVLIAHGTRPEDFSIVGHPGGHFNLLEDDNIERLATFFKRFDTPTIDLLACTLLPFWKESLTKLEEKTAMNIRVSDDDTGNLKVGGDWILESDNVNVKDLYFTDEINKYLGLLYTSRSPLRR